MFSVLNPWTTGSEYLIVPMTRKQCRKFMVLEELSQDVPSRQRIILRHEETFVDRCCISGVQVNPLLSVTPRNLCCLTKGIVEPFTQMGYFQICRLEKNIASTFPETVPNRKHADARQLFVERCKREEISHLLCPVYQRHLVPVTVFT